MEFPRGPRKPLSQRRARSLDRSQDPRKNSESWEGQCLSLPATPSRQAPPRRASDRSGRPKSPVSPEAPGTVGIAPSPEGTRELLHSEQRPLRDTKKDKAQSRTQQGWLKTALNFFLRTGPEETRDKASRRAKGKEGLPQPAETSEWPGQPSPRKKAHDKKGGRKKHGHKKHADEETKGTDAQEAEGQEAVPPPTAMASRSQETDLGPGPRGGEDSDLHQSLLLEGPNAGISEPSSQATGHWQVEKLKKLDQDTIIQMIVQLLRDVGDHLEGEVKDLTQFLSSPPQQLQAPEPEVAPQNPAAGLRKKSQEKSNLKRTISHKKHGSEEPKSAGAADAPRPGSRPTKRPSFLYLCFGGHRPSISNSLDLEEPQVQEALSTDCGDLHPFEPSTQAGSQGPGEDLQPDRASECREFIQKIITLLQDEEEQEGEQLQVQELEGALENLVQPCRKKSQEKKSSFRKAFSHKKHSSKEPKRVGAAGATSPESRPPKRPSYLPLCVGGHRPSISSSLDPEGLEIWDSSPAEGGQVGSSEAPSQTRGHTPEGRPLPDGAHESKELIIQKLMVLLQGIDGHLGKQIRRHPSFKKLFYQLPDSSLIKLEATLRRRGTHSLEPHRDLTERPYQFAFSLANKFSGKNCHATLSLMGLHYPQFLCKEAQQNITSPDVQSPD
ncbi:PREDICTED: uncharacterized protein C6orf222 homolog [Miniopterus natalensis]|uniref:uncharacterized protein C6orf222 homolog n=1 Tax=Miniopterus natalensis TaxID=291302 RepID=UPI0007A6B01D|nr:PREDICTED: uncharacterized protein C6orf222 homolog [Miniopterus natalensis]